MAEQSPLDELARIVQEAKANREAAENQLNTTPSWRVRRRVRQKRLVQRRVAQEREVLALRDSVTAAPPGQTDR